MKRNQEETFSLVTIKRELLACEIEILLEKKRTCSTQ